MSDAALSALAQVSPPATTPTPTPVTSRQHIQLAKELAAAMLPMMVQRLGVQTMALDDPEVTGKAMDRLSKLAGATEDRAASSKPIIHFNITSSGANVSIKTRTPASGGADEADIDITSIEDAQLVVEMPPGEAGSWAHAFTDMDDE